VCFVQQFYFVLTEVLRLSKTFRKVTTRQLVRFFEMAETKKGKQPAKKKEKAVGRVYEVASSRADRELFERFAGYLGDIYDPAGATPRLAPSRDVHFGAPRRKPFDISYTAGSGGNELVIFKMYPRLEHTLLKSVGGTVPPAGVDNVAFFRVEGSVGPDTTTGTTGMNFNAYGGVDDPEFELATSQAVVSGSNTDIVEVAAGPAAAVPMTVVNRSAYGFRLYTYLRETGTGTWMSMASFNNIVIPAGASFTSSASLAAGFDAIAFLVRNGNTSTTKAINFEVVMNGKVPSSTAQTLTYPAGTSSSLSVLSGNQDLDEFRIVGMSMLLTCMGAYDTLAGRVACAMVPRHWTPDPADPLGSIAALPVGAWDGPLEKGCHIVWQPREGQDFSYNPIEWDNGSYYIIIAALLTQPYTPIRLKGSCNYEIFTLDPAIGAMAPCPSAFGLNEVMSAVFASVPPGSSNDDHPKKKRGVLAVVRRLAKQPLDWVMKNPEEVIRMGKLAAAALM